MRTIWKDTKPISDVVTFRLPAPFTLRHIACETPDTISVWAEVVPDGSPLARTFAVVGTGHPIPAVVEGSGLFAVTCVVPPFVWHVYEITGSV